MTDEERFQRLTERHEALAQTVELMLHSIEEERRNIQEQNRGIQEQSRGIQEQSRNIDRILHIVEGQTTHVEALFALVGKLAETAENHERRIGRIEGIQ